MRFSPYLFHSGFVMVCCPITMEVPGKEKEMRGKKREGQLEIERMRKIALERMREFC